MGLRKKRDWTKPLTNSELFTCVSSCYKQIPIDVLYEVLSENYIHKSPYSLSFYNKEKDWNYTQDETVRYSNHWNFLARKTGNKLHAKTDINITQDVWAKGIYDEKSDIYTIIKRYENRQSTKVEIAELMRKFFPINPNKPSQEILDKLKQFGIDVQIGKVFIKTDNGLKLIKHFGKNLIKLEDDSKLDTKYFKNFTAKYPNFSIFYNGKQYTEQELYDNHFLYGHSNIKKD
jgi:hypothetical protein